MKQLVLLSAASLIFAAYVMTLSPNVAGGDSGELLAEGCMLGTAHPPGYPLFTMMTYALHTSFPQYNAAYLVNVSSALLTALAAYFMGKVMVDFYKSSIAAALFSMGMFSFSPLIWQYAVTAEVFPINTFFSSYIVYLVCKFASSRSIGVAIWGAFICGLALTNQHTIILFEVPLILWMMYLLRFNLLKDSLALCYKIGVAFIIGILPYIYMPLAASISPKPGSWGHVSTLSGFLHHFLRKDYGTLQLFSGESGKNAESMMTRNIAFIKDMYEQQGFYVVPVFALIAILVCFYDYAKKYKSSTSSNNSSSNSKGGQSRSKTSRSEIASAEKKKKEIVAEEIVTERSIETIINNDSTHTQLVLIVTLFFYFLVFHSLSNLPLSDKLLYGVHQRFWMQPGVIFFVLGGVGFDYVSNFVINVDFINNAYSLSASKTTFLGFLASTIKIAAAIWIVFLHYNRNLFISDQHDAYHFKNYASAILSPLPPNALLLVNYDMQWTSIRYLQKCENFRNDVTAINLSMMTYSWFQHKHKLYPNITFPGKYHCNSEAAKNKDAMRQKQCFSMFAFVEDNIDKIDIFLSGKLSYQDKLLSEKYDWMPFGLVSKAVDRSKIPDSKSYSKTSDFSWEHVHRLLPSLPNVSKYPEETWEWTIGRDFKDRVAETAAYRLELAIEHEKVSIQPLIDAMYWIETAILLDGDGVLTSVLKNAGLAHIHLIQNPLLSDVKSLALPSTDYFQIVTILGWPTASDDSWKLWCSSKFLQYWGLFIDRPDAPGDSQYATIKAMHSKASEILKPFASGNGQQEKKQVKAAAKKETWSDGISSDSDSEVILDAASPNSNLKVDFSGPSGVLESEVSLDGEEDKTFAKKTTKPKRKRAKAQV